MNTALKVGLWFQGIQWSIFVFVIGVILFGNFVEFIKDYINFTNMIIFTFICTNIASLILIGFGAIKESKN